MSRLIAARACDGAGYRDGAPCAHAPRGRATYDAPRISHANNDPTHAIYMHALGAGGFVTSLRTRDTPYRSRHRCATDCGVPRERICGQSRSGPGSSSAPPLPAEPNFGAVNHPHVVVRGGLGAMASSASPAGAGFGGASAAEPTALSWSSCLECAMRSPVSVRTRTASCMPTCTQKTWNSSLARCEHGLRTRRDLRNAHPAFSLGSYTEHTFVAYRGKHHPHISSP